MDYLKNFRGDTMFDLKVGLLLFIITSIVIIGFHCIVASMDTYKKNKEVISFEGLEYKSMSLLIPCYNEAVVIRTALSTIKKLKYPNLEVIFINDGSSDDTLNILDKELNLRKIPNGYGDFQCNKINGTYVSDKNKNIFVIDKINGGKADSLNAGSNFASKRYVVTLDADSILKEDALDHINYTLQNSDVIAVGGNVVAAQGVKNYNGDTIFCKFKGNFLEKIQFIEYLRGFYVLKNSYAKLNALSVISGAFGVFDKEVMIKVGGFENTVGEDIDITIKFARYAKENNKKLAYNDKAICFTELPNNWSDLRKQRVRWQKAFLDAMKNHFSFIINNCLTNPLAFVMLFDNFLLMYATTIITFVSFIVVFLLLLLGNTVDSIFYVMFTIGIIMFLLYNIVTFRIMKNSCLSVKHLKIRHIAQVLTYEFLCYRPIMNAIILYGSIEFIFNPGGWNKVQRIGVVDEEKEVVV